MRAMGRKFLTVAAPLSTMAAITFFPPAWAGPTYQFAGAVTTVQGALAGGGISVGDPVRLSFTLGAPVADADSAASVGAWLGAVESWSMSIGAFTLTGSDGGVLVRNYPSGDPTNCGSSNAYPFFGNSQYIGKDAVRFVGRQLTSSAIVLNGITQSCGGDPSAQCANANVYDDLARLTGTDIPALSRHGDLQLQRQQRAHSVWPHEQPLKRHLHGGCSRSRAGDGRASRHRPRGSGGVASTPPY